MGKLEEVKKKVARAIGMMENVEMTYTEEFVICIEDTQWLVSEVERLKKKGRLFSKNRRLLVESNKLFIEENKRLRAALRKYGSHTVIVEDGKHVGVCEFLKHSRNPCTCGFKEALEQW